METNMQFALRNMRMALVTLAALALMGMAAAQDLSDVVAEIDGQKISRAEVHEKQAGPLLQARYDFFQAEQKALNNFVAQRLLENEARRQHLSVEQLVKREVEDKVPEPTAEQLRLVYDILDTKEAFEAVRGKIRESIRTQQIKKAGLAYIEALHEKATVVLLLAPPSSKVEVGNAFRLGPADAPVQLIEFADYECPYCIKAYAELKKAKAEFGDRISFVYKDFPLPMHAHAQKAAEAARCAGAQNKYWEYHERLFSTTAIDLPQLKQFAMDLGLDRAKFDKCVDSGEQAAAVQNDAAEAQKIGLTGTPSFFLNGHFFTGAVKYDDLRHMVLQELAKKEGAKNKPLAANVTR
jgi:protein-disulfide isomerase